MRCIEDVTLNLEGLTVLIGDNGSGKSTILDAFELLRQAAKPLNFVTDVLSRHGGLTSLLRHGSPELVLGVVVEGDGPKLDYGFTIRFSGTSPEIVQEALESYPSAEAPQRIRVLTRAGRQTSGLHAPGAPVQLHTAPQNLALPSFIVQAHPAFHRVQAALDRIDHQVPFDTRPVWQQRDLGIREGPRWPSMLDQAEGVQRYGLILPNCYQQLRNDATMWTRVLEFARLGLGEDLRDFRLTPTGAGEVKLEVVFGQWPDKPMPMDSLSEGQLSYLLFIALVELNQQRSVLVFDEPEAHMHPGLLARVAWMLEEAAERCPVVLATHSDTLLDAIAHPEDSVVLCELDERRATRLLRPNKERLADWLRDYRGLGSIRAQGYEAHVFDPALSPSCPDEAAA